MIINTGLQPAMTSDELLALIETGKFTLLEHINHLRAEIALKRREFENMGGVDKYDSGILEVVNRAGDKGVTAADLHYAFPDGTLINQAKARLIADNSITAKKSGMTWLLKVPDTSPAANTQAATETAVTTA